MSKLSKDQSTISVVISAYNEEEQISACLSSVSWADEIIVVDNESSDSTAAMAKKLGAAVFRRKNFPMLNINKNFGFTRATGKWILNLDADERVSEELKKEIQKVVSNQLSVISYHAYELPRKNIIFGKWIRHTGWWPDYQMRLFRRGKGRFPEQHVHEKIVVEGTVGQLQNPIIHENYKTVSQFIEKMNKYTDNEAEQLVLKGYTYEPRDIIRFPKDEFLRRFFAQEGFRDEYHGLSLSFLMSFYHLVILLKLWEKKGFTEHRLAEINADKELMTAFLEFQHWARKTSTRKNNLTKYIRSLLIKILYKL